MGCCKKCGKMMCLLLLLVGVLFLLQDMMIWDFWNLSWYTVAFLLLGLKMWCKASCGSSCEMPAKKKGKKK